MAKNGFTVRIVNDSKLRDIIADVAQQDVGRKVIHDGVEYGVYNELGARGRSARPALVPAFEKHTRQLSDAVGQAIERGVPLDDVFGKVAHDIEAEWADNVPVDTGAYKGSITVSE